MTFDKVKTMRSAEKFLSQGKIRAAIDEYRKVVESDPKDYSTMNILGDLYVKASDNQEAVKCFTFVAEHYNKQGFAQKAIAIYNKVSKITPDSPEVIAKLAKLYEMRGSLAEARQHYYMLAEQYEKKGRKIEALAVWKQIAEVDPNNTDIYLKIGDAYWQEHQREDAIEAFNQAGKRLMQKDQFESAVTAFSKVLQVSPENIEALRGYVKAQISLGLADEAAKALEEAAQKQPMNREVVYMLVDCYLETKEPSKAEETLVRLVEKEPANYAKLLDLIQYYLKERNVEASARILTMASEHMLVGGQAEYLRRLLDDLLSLNPEHLDGLRLLVRFHSWLRDEAELKEALVRFAESSRENNSPEDEKYALTQLVVMLPHEVDYARRLHELNVELGEDPGAIEEADTAAKEDVPTFESFATLADEGDSMESRIGQDDFSDFPAAELNQFGNHLSLNGNGFKDEEYAGEVNELLDASFVDIAPENSDAESMPADSDKEADKADGQFPALSHYEEKAFHEEIDSIDFYISQGYNDLALRALDELEEKFGGRAKILNLRAKINSAEQNANDSTTETDNVSTAVEENKSDVSEESTEFSFVSENQEAVADQGAASPAQETAAESQESKAFEFDAPNDPMADVPELKRSEPQDEPADAEEKNLSAPETEDSQTEQDTSYSFSDQDEMAEDLKVESQEAKEDERSSETAEDFALTEEAAPQLSQSDELLGQSESAEAQPAPAENEVFAQSAFEDFRAGLEVDDHNLSGDNDYETHFNMGIAYKEMGLVEDAIKEFQDAIKFVEPNDGTRRAFECCNMLGYCFMEKGMPNLALIWYKKCLQTNDLTEDEMQGVNYEIANAYEAEGDKAKATQHFSEIYAVDVDYRDVGERLQRLQ